MAFPKFHDGGRPVERQEPVKVVIDAPVPDHGIHDRPSSTNERVEALPRRRYGAEAGRLYLLMSGLVVTPLQRHDSARPTWDVRVLVGNATYGVGGYDLSVSEAELEVATEIELVLGKTPSSDVSTEPFEWEVGLI